MIDPVTFETVLKTAALGLASRANARIASFLVSNLERLGRSAYDNLVVSLHLGFQEYFISSFQRCSKFKSILDSSEPLSVTEKYVNVSLKYGTQKLKDATLIRDLTAERPLVITGLAGSGKSMFMRFMTLKLFEDEVGPIPLFVELRHLNNISNKNLLTFIRSGSSSTGRAVSEEQFSIALRHGCFVLILDGFDEVNENLRKDLETEILALRRDYRNTKIVVSSRPDYRFASWAEFAVYEVEKLTKTQIILLIQGFNYDDGVKRRFFREINEKLLQTHASFLSSPLLCTIMILTYREVAEVPLRMHVFYALAFETLMYKHDTYKEQFRRTFHSKLAKEEMRECFTAFCAISYFSEMVSFRTEDLENVASQAIAFVKTRGNLKQEVAVADLLRDFCESLCMLQPDGSETAFVHRSFQEYFTARFISNLQAEKMCAVLDRIAMRLTDSVIPMLYDMDPDNVSHQWIEPVVRRLQTLFQFDKTMDAHDHLAPFFDGCFAQRSVSKIVMFASYSDYNNASALYMFVNLFPAYFKRSEIFQFHSELTLTQARIFLTHITAGTPAYDAFKALLSKSLKKTEESSNPFGDAFITIKQADLTRYWVARNVADAFITHTRSGLEQVADSLRSRELSRSALLEVMLDAGKRPRPKH